MSTVCDAASMPEARGTVDRLGTEMPETMLGFVKQVSLKSQLALFVLAVVVFLLMTLPLDLQRRIVNDAVRNGDLRAILLLAAAYAGVALTQGAVKLVLNVYQAWVSENAIRHIRRIFYQLICAVPEEQRAAKHEGVEISVILSEADPVGGFVGIAISEPVQHGGLLLSVFGYMAYLQPWMALLTLAIFAPQIGFVPLMQKSINKAAAERIKTLREVGINIIAENESGARDASEQFERIDRVFALNMRVNRLKYWMNFFINAISHFGTAAVLGLGGWLAVEGRIEVGTIVAFISGIQKVSQPWDETINWYRDLTMAQVKYKLIADAVRSFARNLKEGGPPADQPQAAE